MPLGTKAAIFRGDVVFVSCLFNEFTEERGFISLGNTKKN
jgi:hypothetical protein